jgi:hypothetical protein
MVARKASIRAYGAQKAFQEQSLDRIDRYSKSARTFYNLNRYEYLIPSSTILAQFVQMGLHPY